MKSERFDDVQHICSDGADDSQPVREEVQMSLQERGESVAVVRTMVFGVAKPVDKNETSLVGKFSLTSKQLQRFQDAFNKCCRGIGQTTRIRQKLLQSIVSSDQPMEVSHVWVLDELSSERVNELRDGAS